MVDCILFDVDGVLVDVRRSYNVAIKRTVDFVIKYATGNSTLSRLASEKLISDFRKTGGFNNDVDTCYGVILAGLVMKHKNISDARKFVTLMTRALERNQRRMQEENENDFDNTYQEDARENHSHGIGIEEIERYLSSMSSSSSSSSISLSLKKYKRLLNYPSPVGKGLLATVFDEFFYGPELFVIQHKIKPRYYFGSPLISNDKLIVTEHTVKCLSHKFNHNLAIVSGRSKIAAEYSLGSILDYFNKNACVFLEDEVRGYAKPNPYAIISALKNLNAKSAIYVGDSTEDILMARKAEQRIGAEIVFVGAYGHAIDPRGTIRQFKDRKADAIIENVNQLPNIINKVERKSDNPD